MFVLDNLKKRLDINNDSDSYYHLDNTYSDLKNMQARLNIRGGTDQWTRMREDKLKSLKKALLYSYQSAIVQKYDANKDTLAIKIKNIVEILKHEQVEELTQEQKDLLTELEQQYSFLEGDKTSLIYQQLLQNIAQQLQTQQPYFRCLINHDKLKVDYEDKIISIPFMEPPVGGVDPIQTGFHNGTVFKWVHGNKQEWTPDTYWIVYMQYSEETAYFRAEIRKADEEIEIITIDDEGNENSTTYRGWMTGPNETDTLWNIKRGVVWNDMNYTKLLYITKDEDTTAFFQRFDRVIINGKPWEIQAYNESYSVNKYKDIDQGIIRVALKETYTNTDQFIRESLSAAQAENAQDQSEDVQTDARIEGPNKAYPYDILVYKAKGFTQDATWSISNPSLAIIKELSDNGKTAYVEIVSDVSNKQGFDINYGDLEDTKIHVTIESF